jgi:hypothetical protein
MLVGMGSGRETAEIHYWLTDEKGEKVFDNKDTIRAEFWGNASPARLVNSLILSPTRLADESRTLS